MLCAIAVPTSAQITTGTVSGTVKDAHGAIVPGAAVTLVSETRGAKTAGVFTNANGDFVFVNASPDRYTVQIAMPGFKTLEHSGIAVTAGDRFDLGALLIEVGGLEETVQVRAEAPVIQARSGTRRNGSAAAAIQTSCWMVFRRWIPAATARLLQMNVESIAEIKVVTSGYQAEYGRSSGVHVTAVTRGGTNRFRGSVYDIERNSAWNANSKVNTLNAGPDQIVLLISQLSLRHK